jgi:hypothetical protein
LFIWLCLDTAFYQISDIQYCIALLKLIHHSNCLYKQHPVQIWYTLKINVFSIVLEVSTWHVGCIVKVLHLGLHTVIAAFLQWFFLCRVFFPLKNLFKKLYLILLLLLLFLGVSWTSDNPPFWHSTTCDTARVKNNSDSDKHCEQIVDLVLHMRLRATVRKNRANSGNRWKIDFFHILLKIR